MIEFEYPENWNCTRLKNMVLVNENSLSSSTHSDYILNYLEISNVNNRGVISENEIRELFFLDAPSRARRIVRNGDTVISSVRPNLQAIAHIKHISGNLIASTGFYVVTPIQERLDEKYTYYLLISDGSRQHLEAVAKGVGYPAVDDKDFVTLKFAIPSLLEQRRIAAYLNKTCATIDNTIEAKQKQLGILDALRKSIIHKAVTRGLDDSVELKDSGVEWLGRIPKHWRIRRIKYLCDILRGKFTHRPRNDPRFYNGPYAFIQTGDVTLAGNYIEAYKQTLNEEGFKVSKQFPKGTLVMTIAANIGDVAILNFEACFPDSIVGLYPRHNMDIHYLYYLFIGMRQALFSTSVLNIQHNLNIIRIGTLPTVMAPKKEQCQIATYLDQKCSELTKLEANIEKQISTLEQYRKSLIHECVTGKRRVQIN